MNQGGRIEGLTEVDTVFVEMTPPTHNNSQIPWTDVVYLYITIATILYMKQKDTIGTTFNMDLTKPKRMKPPNFIRRQVK